MIRAAGEAGDWRALAWLLERRYPDRWGRQYRAPQASTNDGRIDMVRLMALARQAEEE